MRYRLRTLSVAPIIAALLSLPVIALGLYVAGYFLMSNATDWTAIASQPVRSRAFEAEWQCYLYEPAAVVESFVSGSDVRLGGYDTRPFGEHVVPQVE
jgi:hypothetical protein